MLRSKDFIVLEIIFLSIVIGSLTISYNLYLHRHDLEIAVGITKPVAISNEYIQRVTEFINEVKQDVSRIRQLSFDKEIDVVIINTTWAVRMWAPKEDSISEDMIYREVVYKATLLVPYNFSIVAGQRGWVAMFLAATAGTTLYINTDYFNPEHSVARNVLAHELTHILQHLHLKMAMESTTADSIMAYSALIEGDAGWTQHLYCMDTGLCTPSPALAIDVRNPYTSLLLFPYIYGESFVKTLYSYGGWELVNRAYSKPPISTSMVMRPERYIAYLFNGSFLPENVTISRSLCQYGEPLYSDTLGEYYILLVLAQRIGLEEAMRAADGWSGDRVELYRDTGSRYPKWMLCWNISWTSQEEAREFYQSFIRALKSSTESISIYGNTAYAKIYAEEIRRGWEPGVEIVPQAINLSILINDRYVAIFSEVTELTYICKACG